MKVPSSTYRLQLNGEFGLADVQALIPYLCDLGVGWLYFSPIFQARADSSHGYDVTNPSHLNHEIGDEAGFGALCEELHARDMGLLLDIVPNHMAADAENPWWRDVLEHGPASLAATFFDVAWDAPGCGSRVIAPVLGRDPEEVVKAGEIAVEEAHGELRFRYFARSFPIDPATYDTVLDGLPDSHALVAAARAIGPRRAADQAARQRRREAGLALKDQLRAWLDAAPHAEALADRLASLDASALRALLDRQAYRLEFWRTGAHHLNYRRFFNISDLAAIRAEDADVFATTHALIFEWIRDRRIDGLRVDHVDGLRHPAEYLRRLRAALGDEYIVVEKILAPGEDLPEDWPIEGTTGYDCLGAVTGLYSEPHGLAQLREDYERRTGSPAWGEIVHEKKKLVIAELFRAELTALARQFAALAQRLGIDAAMDDCAACVTEVTAAMRVYRTYVNDGVSAHDRVVIKQAVNCARHRAPHIPDALYNAFRCLLLDEDLPPEARAARTELVADWQQFTGPVMAKGVEDTAFYTYHALISRCEVGAEPESSIASADEFADWVGRRARRWPHTMNASSTHDTKRSEDVRARLDVLTEMPDAWAAALDRWLGMSERHVQNVDGMRVPGVNEAVMLFQTLLGVWPLEDAAVAELPARLRAFTEKAAREAKAASSWREPNERYEQALFAFIERVLADQEWLADFGRLQATVAWFGALNSLSQLTLRLGMPGVPDVYQGNEDWRFHLVDPDNRGRVDYAELRRKLTRLPVEIGADAVAELLGSWRDGRIKLHATRVGLQLRRAHEPLFRLGEFIPVPVRGRHARNVIAFARRHEQEWALLAVGRYFSQIGQRPLGGAWADTRLELPVAAPGTWRNALTGEISDGRALEAVFATLPFGILIGG